MAFFDKYLQYGFELYNQHNVLIEFQIFLKFIVMYKNHSFIQKSQALIINFHPLILPLCIFIFSLINHLIF